MLVLKTASSRPNEAVPVPPLAEKMSLLYASPGIHDALTSRTNQQTEFSINRFLGWHPVRHTRASVRHTCDIEDDSHDHHDNNGHENEHISQCGHDDDHHNQRYDRTTLMNIWGADYDRMYLPLRCPYSNDPLSELVPVGFPTLIDSRELDHPYYNGRYGTLPDNNYHLIKSGDP